MKKRGRPRIYPEENDGSSYFAKNYYANPEYRKKHLLKSAEKILCTGCGKTTQKGNYSRHKKSFKCVKSTQRRLLKKTHKDLEEYFFEKDYQDQRLNHLVQLGDSIFEKKIENLLKK
jgi:hypothetical protein